MEDKIVIYYSEAYGEWVLMVMGQEIATASEIAELADKAQAYREEYHD